MVEPRKAEVDFSKQLKKRSKLKASEQAKEELDEHIKKKPDKKTIQDVLADPDEQIFFDLAGEKFEIMRVDRDTAVLLMTAWQTIDNSLEAIGEILEMILMNPDEDIPRFNRWWFANSKQHLKKIRTWDGEGEEPLDMERYTDRLFDGLEKVLMTVIDPKFLESPDGS